MVYMADSGRDGWIGSEGERIDVDRRIDRDGLAGGGKRKRGFFWRAGLGVREGNGVGRPPGIRRGEGAEYEVRKDGASELDGQQTDG